MEVVKSNQTSKQKKSAIKILRNLIRPSVKEVVAHELTKNTPWPSPSPMNPMDLPASVIHVPEKEVKHFLKKVVGRYIKTLKQHSMSSVLETLKDPIAQKIPDEKFCDYVFGTCFGKLLTKNLSHKENSIFFDYIDESENYYLYNLDSLKYMKTYEDMYVENTKSLFKKVNNKIEVIAIYIKDQVVTPADGNKWELAKFYVMQGSAIALTACIHPRIHFPVDSINGVTKTLLPKDHTLYQLLEPHMYIQLPLNFAVQFITKSIAHGDQNEIYTPYPCDKEGFFGQVAIGYKGIKGEIKYQKYSYPLDPDKYETSYELFLKKYWHAIYDFVSQVSDAIDLDDPILQKWADSISQYVPGFPNAQEIKEDDKFVRAVTSYIHNCSVSHAVDHYTYSRVPLKHSPLRIRIAFPDKGEDLEVLDLNKLLTKEDYIRHKFANIMFFKENNLTLLRDMRYKFKNKVLNQYVRDFEQSLIKVDKSLAEKDRYIPLDEIAASIQY